MVTLKVTAAGASSTATLTAEDMAQLRCEPRRHTQCDEGAERRVPAHTLR